MPVRAFISSEMESSQDRARREVVRKEIVDLRHVAVVFEELPSRPLPPGMTPIEKCREMVRESDVFLAIIDDAVSPAMEAEIGEAERSLGDERIFYYFTTRGTRDQGATELWHRAKSGHVLVQFTSEEELRQEVRRSMASYLGDATRPRSAVGREIFEEDIELSSGSEWHKRFEFDEGDKVTLTANANRKVYAGLFRRDKYASLNEGQFQFEIGTDSYTQTSDGTISRDDDYYVVVRYGMWNDGVAKVNVRIRRLKTTK